MLPGLCPSQGLHASRLPPPPRMPSAASCGHAFAASLNLTCCDAPDRHSPYTAHISCIVPTTASLTLSWTTPAEVMIDLLQIRHCSIKLLLDGPDVSSLYVPVVVPCSTLLLVAVMCTMHMPLLAAQLPQVYTEQSGHERAPLPVLFFSLHALLSFTALMGGHPLVSLAHKGNQLPHCIIVDALHALPLLLVLLLHQPAHLQQHSKSGQKTSTLWYMSCQLRGL